MNGILAALYIAVSFLIAPIAFGSVQFRVPEMFNHLIVYNKKYFAGIVAGVFFSNLFFSPMKQLDLIFGVGQSALALLIMIASVKFVKSILARMILNTVVFTITMFLIALELQLALEIPFLFAWLTTAAGELVVMALGIPVILALNKRLHFDKLV